MNLKVGFIGGGNMAGALILGALNSGIEPELIGVSDINRDRVMEHVKNGVYGASDNIDLVNKSDIIVLAVKPIYVAQVLDEVKHVLKNKALISIVAGLTVCKLGEYLKDSGCRVMRIMPNLPACVGAGATLLCLEHTFTDAEFTFTKSFLNGAGKYFCVSETMLESATAISGSGPAYAFMFIEAMADAGVLWGLPRDMAYTLSAQALLGAAEVVMQTAKHPAELKDAVCSPGGMTIEAVRVLERAGFRSAIIEAVNACAQKGLDMKANVKTSDKSNNMKNGNDTSNASSTNNISGTSNTSNIFNTSGTSNTSNQPLMNLGEQTVLTGIVSVDEQNSPKVFAKNISIYTDGACSGNPGPGGWGVILEYDGQSMELSGRESMTTNNRMELFAALAGLRMVSAPCNITLYSDSSYLINAFNKKWLVRWQLNGWKTSDGNDVLNKDLWAALLDETSRNNVSFVKVKGHSDNAKNNRCDELARNEILAIKNDNK